MARYSEGWRIHRPPGRKTYLVRFTHNGRRVERSTGRQDPEEAAKEAAKVYADHVQREPPKRAPVRRGDSPALEKLVALWLASDSTIAPRTVPIWTVYGGHWRQRWETLVDVTDSACEEYRNERLRSVLARTVRKELGALRRFLGWCKDHGYLGRVVAVPFVPKRATGTKFEKRRRAAAPELSPDQVEALIEALPEWAVQNKANARPYAVRARFLVGYETGLRPTFLDDLSCPEHYRRGERYLRISVDVDKNRMQRAVPLSEAARSALDAVCPDIGPIFGKHDYRLHIQRAAFKVLPRAAAEVFTGTHFRSAQATHTLETTGNIPGSMHLFGWSRVDTASKYTRASKRAAEDTIRAREAAKHSGGSQRIQVAAK